MRIDEITVEVRDSNFDRQGLIQPVDLATFKAVLRFNNVGTWSITLPVGHPMAEILRLPGSGVIVTGPNGVLLSGPTISATNTKTGENPNGDWEIQGVDDSQILGERLAYPTPTSADVQAQTTAYDTRTGLASTVMYGYVNANIGAAAPVEREITNLYTAADAGLGTTAHASARFDILGELLAGIASVDGLGFDIKQVDGNLEFSVYQPVDRTGTIRMDVANNTLQKTAYGYGAPSATVAIVAGQGEGAARQFEQVVTTDSTAAQTLWQRRIETFIDQRNTSVVDELVQAGKEELADRGSTVTSIDVVPSSDSTMRYGIDWGLGDAVTVVVGEQEVSATVTTVAISIEADGIRVGATVGEPTGVDYEGLIAKKQTNTSKRVNALERKEGGGGGGGGGAASDVEITVKNGTGSTVYKGQAVYITGSDGANLTISLAQANSETTSSKTLGLLKQDLLNGEQGSVITEGFLDNIDTSGLTAGDPMWLSPTTPGGIVFGLANKPVAPNHMVFIGYVLRVQQNNGGYYVKVQNGFENDELHDRLTFVGDTAPASPKDYYFWFKSNTGQLFFRYNDGTSSQWVQINNNTIDAALTNRVTTLETNVRSVPLGGTGASTFTAGSYLKGNNGSAIQAQVGIPAGDITSGSLAIARGGTGFTVGAGLIPVTPTSVGGATASISSTGRVSVTSGTGFFLNGIFTSAFRNYKIIIDHRNMGGAYEYARFCYSDNNHTTVGAYYGGGFYRQGGSTGIWQNTGDGYSYASIGYTADGGYTMIDVFAPQWNGSYGKMLTFNSYGAGNHTQVWSDFMWNGWDAFTGIYIYNGGANYSAEVEVYGYNH